MIRVMTLRAALGFAVVLAWIAAGSTEARADAAGGTVYITPTGAGNRDGSSWESAASLMSLPVLIGRAGPGGKVLIRADLGTYNITRQIEMRVGGEPDRPVTIMGVDSSDRPMKATIVGTRADPYRPDGPPGSAVFRLGRGANHLRFEHLSFRNQGNGCFYVSGDIRDLAIQHVDAANVRRFFENYAAGAPGSATIDGLIIRDVEVKGFSKGAIRLQYDTHNVVLEDILGDSEWQDRDNFAEGVALEGTVHDVLVRRVTMRNSRDTLHAYWNGDGFTAEQNTYRIRFEDTMGSGNTDAGYDLKSNDTVLLRASAEDNKHNFKIWGNNVTIHSCIGRGPHRRGGTGVQDQVEILKGANVTITGCEFVDSDPMTTVFHVETGARLKVLDTKVSRNPTATTSLVEEGGILILK
jgi:hypothetical protein